MTDYPSPEDALEQAAADGAQVVFTTTVPLIFACRKLAPKYPGVRFLNCSVDMPYPGVRTYYSRIYEAKFLLGALAGTLAEDARIGYVADAPVFGTPAAINAFALGAQLTRPDAQILLRWSCCEQEPAAALAAEDIRAVAAALYNSFERAVPPDSAVWDIESALRAHGALAALLSGSGSAVFGLFAREDTARAAAETLRERWPMTFAAQPV